MTNQLLKKFINQLYSFAIVVLLSLIALFGFSRQVYALTQAQMTQHSIEKKKSFNKPLIVILDWFINPDHAPLFVAKEKGFFKQAGIHVQLEPPAANADGPKLVAAGKADIAITYQPQFLIQQAHHLPLTQVGTLVATPLDCLVVLKNGPIKAIRDLKGKRIGYPAGYSQIMLKTMLKQHGLSLKDVHLISTHQGLTQALLAHRIDGFTGAMRNFEPIEMQLRGQLARLFLPENNGFPFYSELILITNTHERNDPRINQFMMALQRGVIYLVNHPQQSWELFAKRHPELNNSLNRKAWFKTLPFFALRPNLIDDSRRQKLAIFLKKQSAIPQTDQAIN